MLHVKGLAEKRPSVLKGDLVNINMPGERRRVYKGEAMIVEQENVHIALDADFRQRYTLGMPVEVRFNLSRMALRIFHQGLELVKQLPSARSLLFPEPRDLTPSGVRERLNTSRLGGAQLALHNHQLNEEQAAAVRAVVDGVARHIPYIIFGPPGTGKSTTIIEAILQLATGARGRLRAPLRVLVCTPTNTAADVILEGLVRAGLSPLELLRLVAYTRAVKDVNVSLLKYTNFDLKTSVFAESPVEEILQKQVVVATLTTVGKLVNAGVPRGHFDVIFVDEAGQALEPETVAAPASLLGPDGQLVLGGDPQQLGPIIHCSAAKEHGLACSLLERLMTRAVYQKASSNPSPRHPPGDLQPVAPPPAHLNSSPNPNGPHAVASALLPAGLQRI